MGRYIVISESSSGAIVHAGYTPLNFTGASGSSYVITAANDKGTVFDHWEDQSKDRNRTVVLSADTGLTAYYSGKNNAAAKLAMPTVTPPSQDKGDQSDEDNDGKTNDDKKEKKKKKEMKEKGKKEKKGNGSNKDGAADDDNNDGGGDSGDSRSRVIVGGNAQAGSAGSWLLPLEKGLEDLLQITGGGIWWGP